MLKIQRKNMTQANNVFEVKKRSQARLPVAVLCTTMPFMKVAGFPCRYDSRKSLACHGNSSIVRKYHKRNH